MLAQDLSEKDLAYYQLLAKQFPSIQSAASEIINLSALLHLPKGTEHFLSDVHGEYEAFSHALRSGSGSIKRKIDEIFGSELDEGERQTLATLIYYPRQKLSLLLKTTEDPDRWFYVTLLRLIRLCRAVSTKYTRTALREALPAGFAGILEEVLQERDGDTDKQPYYESILETIISIGRGSAFVIALAELIQRLEIAHLHILGDIYDRSPGAHLIMDDLLRYHSVDVQWGNHDILWMGAAAGSEACLANVIRVSLRYTNMETLETGYAISLLPLASLAIDVYGDDPCELFTLKDPDPEVYTGQELRLMAQMHKAITIIQLKLEGQVILRRPDYEMQDRLLLDKIDYRKGTVRLYGREYPLLDTHFPTVDPQDPYALTEREQNVVERLRLSFANSEKLQQHVRFLLSRGSMYRIFNGNLLYHGCIPMNEDGTFMAFQEGGRAYTGREFLNYLDRLVRQGSLAEDPERKQRGLDAMWYLWTGPKSPLFGKDKMATFERYFIADKETHREEKNAYYRYRDQEETACRILAEFGLDPEQAHIINGHVPVRVVRGENPVKAGGKLLVIDGGFAKAYQAQTGIAGYTLVYNSYGLLLASHQPFESVQKVVEEEGSQAMQTRTKILETNNRRILIEDTDQGRRVQQRITELKNLLQAYRSGVIQEKRTFEE